MHQRQYAESLLLQSTDIVVTVRRLIQLVETVQKQGLALGPDEHTALRMLANSVTQATDIAIQVSLWWRIGILEHMLNSRTLHTACSENWPACRRAEINKRAFAASRHFGFLARADIARDSG